MPNYGEKIRKRREELGLSQVQLGELIGETKQTIWKYESGKVTNIPLPKVELIAKALHCSTGYITGWEDEKEPVLKTKDGQEVDYDEFMEIVRQLTAENVELLKDQGRVLLNHQKSQDVQ